MKMKSPKKKSGEKQKNKKNKIGKKTHRGAAVVLHLDVIRRFGAILGCF
jgi:hypothetical protein